MASKKRKQEVFASTIDMHGHDADQAPESTVQSRVTVDEYIAREYGEAIRAGNVARMLEGILVEIVKWRIGK